jgi:hypothetical protein
MQQQTKQNRGSGEQVRNAAGLQVTGSRDRGAEQRSGGVGSVYGMNRHLATKEDKAKQARKC